MTDRPILFSPPMVRALIDGRKTQTRRTTPSRLDLCKPGDRLWVRETFTGNPVAAYRADAQEYHGIKWKPGIHMPRSANRLTLVVTDVRFERLQDITAADAEAESIGPAGCSGFGWPGMKLTNHMGHDSAVDAFRDLWESINGPCGWTLNPRVVAITFTVHRHNIDNPPKE